MDALSSALASSGVDVQALLVCSLARSLYLRAGSHNSLANSPLSFVVLKYTK